jgi:multiple sugar transport system substrate-binding protein
MSQYGPLYGAKWIDASGKSALSTDPHWAQIAEWMKGLTDFYGHDKLVKWQAGTGDEFSTSNAFEQGKVAMMIDGEWRPTFIAENRSTVDYGTSPFPVDDVQPQLYGAGYVNGNIVGIPKGAKHPAEAWEFLKYLATDTKAEVTFANGLGNVPTWKAALTDPALKVNAKFAPFLKVSANPNSASTPVLPIGTANQDLLATFMDKYLAGDVADLQSGLASLDKQVDAQLQQSGADASSGTDVP